MARLTPARRVALALVIQRRRHKGRIRDIARDDAGMHSLTAADKALAFRLALGATAAQSVLDELVDSHLKRPGSVEPRVRDALLVSSFEICYLETPLSAAVSQGVELVRSVSQRAAGLANAVLRRMAEEDRPRVSIARDNLVRGSHDIDDLRLASGLPTWLVKAVLKQRGEGFVRDLCLSQLEPAPVCVAANGLRYGADSLAQQLASQGMEPHPIPALEGSFVLGSTSQTALSRLLEEGDLAVADTSAQLVCRIAAPADDSYEMLEVGQGRGTKSLLMAAANGIRHPRRIEGVDSVAYKVDVSRRRMMAAGLDDVVSCHLLDGLLLGSDNLPDDLGRPFDVVFVDAPCSGTGTMRRHPEIAPTLREQDVRELTSLQLGLLKAASVRVREYGVLVYSTCSVLRDEDEAVVEAFLESEEGRAFEIEPVSQAYACAGNDELQSTVVASQTSKGCLLTRPVVGGGDGHFCARMTRSRS